MHARTDAWSTPRHAPRERPQRKLARQLAARHAASSAAHRRPPPRAFPPSPHSTPAAKFLNPKLTWLFKSQGQKG